MGYFGGYADGYFGNYFGPADAGGIAAPTVATVPAVRVPKRWAPDWSDDYLVWDHREPIKLTSTRRPGSLLDYVTDALRRELTRRELAASNGVYRAGDVVWEVPVKLVKIGRLKPGDVVEDTDEDEYHVLDARHSVDRTIWTLVTRNLAIAEDLRDKINIERALVLESDTGARIKHWPSDLLNPAGTVPYRNLACRVQPQETDVSEERGIKGGRTRFIVYLSREIDVDFDSDRVKFGSRILEITGYTHSEQLGELPYLLAEEAV